MTLAKDGQGQVPTTKSSRPRKEEKRAVGSVRPEALQSTGAKALPPEVRWIADLSSEGDGPKMGPKVKDGPEDTRIKMIRSRGLGLGQSRYATASVIDTFMVREHCTEFVRKFL